VQDEGSENISEGVTLTAAFAAASPEVAGDADEDVLMDEDEEGGETPRKPRPEKRQMVISPTPENEGPLAKRQTRDIDTKPPEWCGPCWTGGWPDCERQTGKKKFATACALCSVRKVTCSPPADWAIAHEAQKVQGGPPTPKPPGDTPKPKATRRQSTTGKATSSTAGKAPPMTLERLYTQMQNNHMEVCAILSNLESKVQDQPKSRHPPVPAFDAPSPAISTSGLSAASAGSGVSATNISRMSLRSPSIAGPSGTGDGQSEAQGIQTRSGSRGRLTKKLPSRAPSAQGSRAASVTRAK